MTSTRSPEPEAPTAARGPERFAVRPVAPARPSLGKAALAALALLGLLVGIPAALWALSGPPPVPSGLPGRDDLTQPLTVDALLTVLAAVVWLAWLQFAVCTLVELVSLVRGGGLPRPVPLSGRSQALARALVGTLLVGTSFLGSTGAASAVTVTPDVATGGTVQVVDERGGAADGVAPGDAAPAGDARAAEPGGPVDRPAQRMERVPGVPADMVDVIGHKVAVVQPPDGHYHDNLWDIAERHLGDGRRWKEVFDLNQGRQQPDGGELVLGRLIQPGWVLIMPDDARGVPRVHAVADEAPAPVPSDEAPLEAPGEAPADAPATDRLASDRLGVALTGGLLAAVLAGALAAERRRRRGTDPGDDALEAEVRLLVGADPERVQRLDHALRALSGTCRAERVALPQVYAASVDDDAVELRVAPPAPTAPAPWSALDGGARWRLERDVAAAHATTEEPADLGHAPYPGLVCLGRDDRGADVLVDLEAVAGPLAVGGAGTVAREVVSALAVQLATAPWADDQQVWGHHLAPVLAAVTGPSLHPVDDLGPLLAAWAEHSPRRDAQEVLGGRLGRHPGSSPQYLLLGSQPDEESLARLDALVAAGARGLGVVAAVPLPGARWRLEVDEAGRLSVPLLDLELDAVRLTEAAAEELATLFAAAREEAAPVAADRPRVPAVPHGTATDDGHWGSAPVRVGLLGPLELRADGQLDASRRDLATEVVVFLAAQTAPVHPSVVGASVWPRGVTPEVRDATIARTRDWLGTDDDGNPLLRETAEGRLHLAPDVAVDWWAFCALVGRARDAAPREERELLRRALQLVRGEVLVGRPAGRYSWLPRTRLERQAVELVVDAAHRLAEVSTDDDPSGAAAACRAGLRLAPTSQVLWRDLLRAEHRRPDGPGTAAVVDEAVQELQAAGGGLEPETEALVVELLPGHRPDDEQVG